MSNLISSGWIVVVLAFLNTGLIMGLNRIKENDGPVLWMRSIQGTLVVTTGLLLYFGFRAFVG